MARIPSSHHATNSPSASLRCSHAKVPSQARCLGKVKLVPLALALVEVFPWVEAEEGFLDHLALEETAFLVPLGLEGHHHTSLARG